MKYISLIALLFTGISALYSQADAGPDKVICGGRGVTIGGAGQNDWCYSWSPADGLSDPNILNPVANPDVTTTYTLKVVGDNFEWTDTDAMTVTVGSKVEDIFSEPLCCYKQGTALTTSNLKITTNPPGMEHEVKIDPPNVPDEYLIGSTWQQNVTLSSECPGDPLEREITITAVNEKFKYGVQHKLTAPDFEKLIKAVENIIKGFDKFTGGCKAKNQFSIIGTVDTSMICCPTPDCIKISEKISGKVRLEGKVKCDFPIPQFSIPYLAQVNVRFELLARAEMGLNYATKCEYTDVCFLVGLTGKGGVGLSFTVAGGTILDASAMAYLNLSVPAAKFCVPSFDWDIYGTGQACASITGEASVTFVSLYQKKVGFTLMHLSCWDIF